MACFINLTYLPTLLLNYILAHLHSYLYTYLLICILIALLTHLLMYSLTHSLIQVITYLLMYILIDLLAHLIMYVLTHLLTPLLVCSLLLNYLADNCISSYLLTDIFIFYVTLLLTFILSSFPTYLFETAYLFVAYLISYLPIPKKWGL